MKKLTHNRQTLPDAQQVHERLWKKLENGLSVWIVVGRLELHCRRHPDEVHGALADEDWT